MTNDPKVEKHKPCVFPDPDPRKKGRMLAPSVDCYFNCRGCAWNPEEHKRRMEEGVFYVNNDGTMTLRFKR